ncbi:hypothetical protein BD560DRAFT_431571 [Blakeslea trispora]|nr:hypothetical protein BD560DRAFT_431571 [Blakeslea trispora]
MIVDKTIAIAIFTLARLFYAAAFGSVTLILFSRLPGGSSTKFWYEQPNLLGKIKSFFRPYGPTGKFGVESTNIVAVVCLVLTLSLNALPTIFTKISPLVAITEPGIKNDTFSPISNVFIPTLTDGNLPQFSNSSQSKNVTNKFLCSYIPNGCTDANGNTVANVIWDEMNITDLQPFHNVSNNDLLVSFSKSGFRIKAEEQQLRLAKDTLGDQLNYTSQLSFHRWNINNFTGLYSNVYLPNLSNDSFGKYDILNSDQMLPLDTPDLSEMLKTGRRKVEALPKNRDINRAERWTAIHNSNYSSYIMWQSTNAHSGETASDWVTNCFFCSLIGIKRDSIEADTIYRSLLTRNSTDPKINTFAIQSYVDDELRLSTVLCTVEYNRTIVGIKYWCVHTFSQVWSVQHDTIPYAIHGTVKGDDADTTQFNDQSSTPFPFFPPPLNVSNPRTYVPVVPIFEVRSKGICNSIWNFRNQTVQEWMKECARDSMGQPDPKNLGEIAKNAWQLSSAMTVRGFLIPTQHHNLTPALELSLPVCIVIGASLVSCILAYLAAWLLTQPVHRRSLYESLRIMIPDSKEPYGDESLRRDLPLTNTLHAANSTYEKNAYHLKLNNKMIVTLSENEMHQQGLTLHDSDEEPKNLL